MTVVPGVDALVFLGVVPGGNAVAEGEGAGVRVGLTREDAHQARLAGAVEAHDDEPFAALDRERDVIEDVGSAVALGDAVDFEDDAPRPRWVGEPHSDALLPFGPGHLITRQPGDPGVDRLRGLGALGGLAAHAVGQLFEPLDLGFLPSREFCESLLVGRARHLILRVRAAVLDHFTFIEMQDARNRRVEQVEVVADDEQRAAVAA